ncbi:MAG: M48 family metalloprotease [Fimbriimonadaceae bacterium]|nr:MAG: M48 family metalloprotease [Fimbriimonadaceae bacterium]
MLVALLFSRQADTPENRFLFVVFLPSLGFATFPIFLQSLLRVYEPDIKVFGPTPEQKIVQNPSLELEKNLSALHAKLRKINIVCATTIALLVVAEIVVWNTVPTAFIAILIALPLVSLVFFILLFKSVWFRLKPEVSSEHLALLSQNVAKAATDMGLATPKAFVIPPLATVPYNCVAHPKGLYISSQMLKDFSEEECRFIICHELAHVKLNHLKVRQRLRSTSIALASFSILIIYFNPQLVLWILGLLFLLLFASQKYIRNIYPKQEFEADALAIQTTGNPLAAAESLNRIAVNSAFPGLMYFDNPTHPSITKRTEAMFKVSLDEQVP